MTSARSRVQHRVASSPRARWWVLVVLLAGLFSLNFTFTVFVVDYHTLKTQFHTNYSVLTWLSIGPLLAFGLAAPLFGRAGDLHGYRRLYLFGLCGAMIATAATALAPNVWLLIGARSLDGIQGAATGTASMALILRVFAPEDRVKAMGWWSMVGAGGPVIGITIGSPIIQHFGFRALFWFQLVLLVISAALVLLVLPAKIEGTAEPGPRTMDWIGSWSLSGMVIALMLLLSTGPFLGWISAFGICAIGFGVAAAAVFVHRERTAEYPLIPTEYFRRRNFMFPMGTRAGVSFSYFGGFFLFPLVMEEVYHWSISRVGFVSIARPLVFSLSSPIAGYCAVRIGERASAVLGAACAVGSMVLFAELGAAPSLFIIVLALSLAGLGMGVSLPSTSSSQANEVERNQFGVMGATQQLATQVGQVAGIQVSITVEETLSKHGPLLSAYRAAFWIGAGAAAFGLICAAFIRPMDRTKRMERAPRAEAAVMME